LLFLPESRNLGMVKRILLLVLVGAASVISGCKSLYSSRMIQTPKEFAYTEKGSQLPQEFRLEVNDLVQFSLYSNDGFRLVDISPTASAQLAQGNNQTYQVEFDGTIKMPLLGRMKLQGLTVREAEMLLEEKYSEYYKKPYVIVRVSNRRVLVFPGSDGAARVVPLNNNTTSVAEIIAMAGGIPTTAKAYSIKLIRGPKENQQVFLLDLSTLDGFNAGNMIVQSNDIIYVEARPMVARNLSQEIGPYISLLNTLLLGYSIIRSSTR